MPPPDILSSKFAPSKLTTPKLASKKAFTCFSELGESKLSVFHHCITVLRAPAGRIAGPDSPQLGTGPGL